MDYQQTDLNEVRINFSTDSGGVGNNHYQHADDNGSYHLLGNNNVNHDNDSLSHSAGSNRISML